MTLLTFLRRRLTLLIIILAVISLSVAAAASSTTDQKTNLLQAAASSQPGQPPADTPGLQLIGREHPTTGFGNAISPNNPSGAASWPGSNPAYPVQPTPVQPAPPTGCPGCPSSAAATTVTAPSGVMCPMYCVAPVTPTPTPMPTPSPAPLPTQPPVKCGCNVQTYQPHQVCLMYCAAPAY